MLATVLNLEKVEFLLKPAPQYLFLDTKFVTGPNVFQCIPARIVLAPRSISTFNIRLSRTTFLLSFSYRQEDAIIAAVVAVFSATTVQTSPHRK